MKREDGVCVGMDDGVELKEGSVGRDFLLLCRILSVA
jgi:hypothetical protein